MQFMILRRADQFTESARPSAAESALLYASLKPSDTAVRLSIRDGVSTVAHGPFPDPADMIAGFAVIDVPSKEEAVAWSRRWPAGEHAVELEVRESGCPGGCAEVVAAPSDKEGKRYAILLRSSPDLENETPVPQHRLDALDASNAKEAAAGVLLAGDGLRGTGRGARVKVSRSAVSVIDGPFTEIKELIAGFWMIRVASMDDAIAWAKRNPYPTGPDVDVEIRELYELSDDISRFTPDLESAEQRIRAEQLEAGMRAHFTA